MTQELVTKKDLTMEWKGFNLSIPKGTPTTHETASGFDIDYNFISDFSWYTDVDTRSAFLHDATHYGINIPRHNLVPPISLESTLVKKQSQTFKKFFSRAGKPRTIFCTIRYDDNCSNGHNSFAITGTVCTGTREEDSCAEVPDRAWQEFGCIHDGIYKHFPEFRHLIKWHLSSSEGPFGYIGNTLYHANDKDHRGKRKGEPWAWDQGITFGDNPIAHKHKDGFVDWLKAIELKDVFVDRVDYEGDHDFSPKYTLATVKNPYTKEWHKCPFDTFIEAENFLAALRKFKWKIVTIPIFFSEGKEPDFDAARQCAIWPDATESQLRDKVALEERLPTLLAAMQADIEKLGFIW